MSVIFTAELLTPPLDPCLAGEALMCVSSLGVLGACGRMLPNELPPPRPREAKPASRLLPGLTKSLMASLLAWLAWLSLLRDSGMLWS